MSVVGGVAATTPAGLLEMLPLHTACVCVCVCERQRQAERGRWEGLSAAHALPATAAGPLHAPHWPAAFTFPAASEFVPYLSRVLDPSSRRALPAPSAASPALPLCPRALVPFHHPWLGVAPRLG